MPETPQQLARRMTAALALRGLRPCDLYRRADVGAQTWSRMMNGIGGTSSTTTMKLQIAFDEMTGDAAE